MPALKVADLIDINVFRLGRIATATTLYTKVNTVDRIHNYVRPMELGDVTNIWHAHTYMTRWNLFHDTVSTDNYSLKRFDISPFLDIVAYCYSGNCPEMKKKKPKQNVQTNIKRRNFRAICIEWEWEMWAAMLVYLTNACLTTYTPTNCLLKQKCTQKMKVDYLILHIICATDSVNRLTLCTYILCKYILLFYLNT